MGFYPPALLSQQDYWVSLQVSSGSNYYVGIDNTVATKYISGPSNSIASGSVVGFVRIPSNLTFGGRYEGTIVFRCMSKNRTDQAYDLSELVMQYLELGKHAILSRETDATNGLELSDDLVGSLSIADINISNIRIGGVENRRRGEKDLIFTVPVSITVMTEFSQAFDAEYLKNLTTTTSTFIKFDTFLDT